MSTYWPPFSVAGASVDLSHLDPTTLLCPIDPPQPGVPAELSIHVTYSYHCFTDHLEGAYDPLLVWPHQKPDRLFSQDRFGWSQDLPAIIARLPMAKVRQTSVRRNYVYFWAAMPNDPKYGVFFSLKRASGSGSHLSMFIESAYRPDVPNTGVGTVRFKVLATKVFQGLPIVFNQRR